jgi:hypothetical protein
MKSVYKLPSFRLWASGFRVQENRWNLATFKIEKFDRGLKPET